MGAPKGNKFWEARAKHGRDLIFKDPESLWNACVEYFEWVEENPLYEAQAFAYQGCVTQEPVAKMRAMTIAGIARYLHINQDTWYEYGKREGFSEVVTRAEEVIRDQKFAGAAAGLLNPNIIARDLGLKESHSVDGEMRYSFAMNYGNPEGD